MTEWVKVRDVEDLLKTLWQFGYKADKHTLAMVKACLSDLSHKAYPTKENGT